MSIAILLPFPPAELSPNSRCHWREKAAAVQAYRHECEVRARQQIGWTMPPPWKHTNATITFILKDKRRHDWDNLLASFKAGIDGIVDAGLLPDDDVKSWSPTLRYEQGNKAAIRIEFTS